MKVWITQQITELINRLITNLNLTFINIDPDSSSRLPIISIRIRDGLGDMAPCQCDHEHTQHKYIRFFHLFLR